MIKNKNILNLHNNKNLKEMIKNGKKIKIILKGIKIKQTDQKINQSFKRKKNIKFRK